ncbi:unnamed protein product [Adineta ricciae]|uniref:Uncharacterized protein n=1 Tax=Adineta ricciae TaxID=249248 RepID=A0A814DEM6_ADIRI|nr:unnamed protein product [Adineta ricciae]
MGPTVFYRWIYEKGRNYNLFALDENDYHENNDDENEVQDSATVLKQQKYATWLYVLLIFMSLYVLFYLTLMTSHSQTTTVPSITRDHFEQLYQDHSETLVCPCSTIELPHKNFITSNITFHAFCSSVFVSRQWIERLYLVNASDYGPADFRATAKSQFQLLADLCSMSMNTVLQTQQDFDNDEFTSINLLPEDQVQSEMNVAIDMIKSSISTQIVSFVNYVRVYVRGNFIVSSLNTNLMLSTYLTGTQYLIYQLQTQFTPDSSIFTTTTSSLMCSSQNPTTPTGFFPNLATTAAFTRAGWTVPAANSTLVNGFFTGCTSFEALLAGTLDCLYDRQCIQLLVRYFPALTQLNLNWTNSSLNAANQNVTVYNNLFDLFVEDWSTEVSYSQYFNECAPVSCSYTVTDQRELSYALTMFISLYGGLIIILRLIAPSVVKLCSKLEMCMTHRNVQQGLQNIHPQQLIKSIKQLNLFKNIDKRSENDIKQQRIMTRIYLFLLAGSFLVLLLFTSLETEILTITTSNPSLTTYSNLEKSHSNTLRCPCSSTTIPYEQFMTLSPTLHQVCSSDFITTSWLAILQLATDYQLEDWRNRAYSQFQLLSNLCQLAKNTIDDAVRRFLVQSLVVSSILTEYEFNIQINAILDQFFQSTIRSFGSLINITTLLTQIDQFYMGARGTTSWATLDDPFLAINFVTNNITLNQSLQVIFNPPGTRYVNLSGINCVCATNASCQAPVAIYQIDYAWSSRVTSYVVYIVPGLARSCFTFSSLMFSQLLCLYADSDCFSILLSYIKSSYYQSVLNPAWFDPRPLVYDPAESRFPPNTTISSIVQQIMVEKWNPSYSYNRFYQLCAPNYCTYSNRMRVRSIVEVFVTFISTIGGLTFALSLIVPLIVKYIHSGLQAFIQKRRQQQGNNQIIYIEYMFRRIPQHGLERLLFCFVPFKVRRRDFSQLKTTVKNAISIGYSSAINLNIFSPRDLGSNTDRVTAKHLGKWATRIYIVLFIIGLSILTLYAAFTPQTITKIFNKPSFTSYNQLKQQYGDQLKCSCSIIASKYAQFTQITPAFHQICTSSFVSDQWRMDVTGDLNANLSTYGRTDYRRFLPAHLQYLQGLCYLSIQSIENSIEQFLTSLFITTELLSSENFHTQLNFSIEQKRSAAPKPFIRLLSLMRSINHGNAFISTYGTNFEYISPWYYTTTSYPYIPNQAIIYDNNCSCGMYPDCTTQANFLKDNFIVLVFTLTMHLHLQ